MTHEPEAPVVVNPQRPSEGMLPAIARAIVSLTLLAVLLLAFGAALAGWFLQNQLRTQFAEEVQRTPPQAQLIIEYRDALDAATRQMENERSQAQLPAMSEVYAEMMTRRGGAAGEFREGFDLQSEIDLLQRDNADLRWANEQMRARAASARDPRLPALNQQP
ncbi:MAG: hypothetical protein ABL883_05155 [Terricaulis sp.]